MRGLVASRWFALGNLACALAAAGWWVVAHQATAWPLALALAPWGFNLAARKFMFQRTPLDIPLFLFLFTAGMGIWAANDSVSANHKFWMIIASALVFYALAGQPRSNHWMIAGIMGVFAAGFSAYFLLTNSWKLYPADLGFLNRLGNAWMELRPPVHGPMIQPNIAGGILAMLLPINLAWAIYIWQAGNKRSFWIISGITALVAVGILMTSSRAAWMALLLGLGIWGWWHLSGLVAQRLKKRQVLTFGLPILIAIILVLGVIGLRGSNFIQAANNLPGTADAGSRAEITRNTIQLIRDFPFTGGGLASFPGLYSSYIRMILVPEFFYSHNLYLDIALEQGLIGLIAFLALVTVTGGMLIKYLASHPSQSYLAGASLAGLAAVLLHGFLDDALYGMGGTPLLFLLPGIIASVYLSNRISSQLSDGNTLSYRRFPPTRAYWVWGCALLVLGLSGISLFFVKPLRSALYANLGAVSMSHIDGLIWPDTLSEPRLTQASLNPIANLFDKALEQDPHNATALFRLGILNYFKSDFAKSTSYLASAYTQEPNHRGIQKLLGYSYTWTGDSIKAQALLNQFPEAQEELDAYTWWWETQNRTDLSELASQMAAQLKQR